MNVIVVLRYSLLQILTKNAYVTEYYNCVVILVILVTTLSAVTMHRSGMRFDLGSRLNCGRDHECLNLSISFINVLELPCSIQKTICLFETNRNKKLD